MSLILLRITIAFYSVGLLHSFITIITRKKTCFVWRSSELALAFWHMGCPLSTVG